MMSYLDYSTEKRRWVFQRISGMILIIAVCLHTWVFLFKLGRPVSHEELNALLSHPEWLIFYALFIALTVYHGFLGLWTVLTDRNPSRTFKKWLRIILISFGSLIVILCEWNLILLAR
jgi:succinate dehydrogenase hydrophobic membrane anchor protein